MKLIPTTVFTGFLGAGKTTIIGHLIEELQSTGEQIAYIKNEIGDADIDTQIIQGKNIQTKQLLNGCICCTLTGPFTTAIDEIIESVRPTRIIVEASGTADVAALALMISSHPKLFRDGVLTIIDVVNFEGFADLTITAQNQTHFTDLVVFNKVELVDDKRKHAVVGYVRELNTHSPIIEAPHGKLSPLVVFGVSSQELESLLNTKQSNTHDHSEEDHIEGFHVDLTHAVDVTALKRTIEQLPDYVFRVKGLVFDDAHQLFSIQKVGKRVEVHPVQLTTQPTHGKLIFIGYDLLHSKDFLLEKLIEFK